MAWKFSDRVSGIRLVLELIFQNENKGFMSSETTGNQNKLSGKVGKNS